jgi:predicted PurR-regulated permease PerM
MVPYIGGLVATGLAMMVALATQEPTAALWVLLLFLAVQFVDNNVIVPRIVASRVEINALVSILVVLIGGTLWGVPGMFLSLPLTAIIKVICDRIPALMPLGELLGDATPDGHTRLLKVHRRAKKAR